MDVFKFTHEEGRSCRSGSAETEGVSARKVKIGKKFARQRNHSTKPRCSEPRTGFTDAREAARFRAKSRGFEKSIPLTYEEGIDRRFPSGFRENRILRQTAKQVFGNRNPLRCFHHKNAAPNKQLGTASRESVRKKLEISEKLRELDELHRMVDVLPPEILQEYTARKNAKHRRMDQEI